MFEVFTFNDGHYQFEAHEVLQGRRSMSCVFQAFKGTGSAMWLAGGLENTEAGAPQGKQKLARKKRRLSYATLPSPVPLAFSRFYTKFRVKSGVLSYGIILCCFVLQSRERTSEQLVEGEHVMTGRLLIHIVEVSHSHHARRKTSKI
jgi:hypothetical protein